jgi:chaperonin GroES
MKGDTLASGGTSATFAGGTPRVDDPIKFNWTVAQEEKPESDESWQATESLLNTVRHQGIIDSLRPLNDRVMLRRIPNPFEDGKKVTIADSYEVKSPYGEVIAVGHGMVLGGEFHPIPLEKGDRVRFGEYSAEEDTVDGEEIVNISIFDIRYKL